jgi:3alpha(or 20beta)-hydroxysteroid dehydrogenase
MKLSGKVALITGAAGGQGAATARRFVAEGAKVALGDLDADGAEAVAASLDGAIATRLDVGEEADWAKFVEAAKVEFGRIDVLVNNAGVYRIASLGETGAALAGEVFRTNQLGPHLGIRAVADPMRESGGGSIVNVSSTAGLIGAAGAIAYITTKWALRGLSRAAAAELAPDIRVNCVLPGLIDTAMAGVNPPGLNEQMIAGTPLGRIGAPDEVVAVNCFLASDESSYLTGTEIVVDGGATIGAAKT